MISVLKVVICEIDRQSWDRTGSRYARRSHDVHRAVVVDTAKTVRVAQEVRTHRVGGGAAQARTRAAWQPGPTRTDRRCRPSCALHRNATLHAYAAHLPRSGTGPATVSNSIESKY